jgi:prepilin-type N-terminal cleavage/methylation domain-containing protein
MYPLSKTVRRARRRAVTLIELMIAVAVMALMASALGALSHAVKITSDYTEGTSNATQHARVALQRINRAVAQGFANESFPGTVAFADTVGSYTYPDTLVVWYPPSGTPVNPSGLPQFNEIVVFCPNPNSPNQLLEITSPSDTRTVPTPTDLTTWNTELTNMKTGTTSQLVLITDLLRTAPTTSGATSRAAVRFVVDLRPSAADWASYRAGTLTFANVPWVQTIYGSQTGLRQTWVHSELQLMPGYNLSSDTTGQVTIPFLGSSSLYWNLHQ